MTRSRIAALTPLALAALLALAGCGDKDHHAADGGHAEKQASASSTDIQAILAKADAADGTVDHVVSKCLSCGLAMDGHGDHAVQHAGYELHLCSAGCKKRVEADPEGVIASLQ